MYPINVEAQIAANPEDIQSNLESSIKRGLPVLQYHVERPGKWLICGGGPSLKKELKKIKRTNGQIVALNGSHDYLLKNKIKPDVFIMTDPRQYNVKFVKNPEKGIIYYIAAHCHPDVFDAIEGYDLRIWFPLEYDIGSFQIGGGSTVGLRAINIGYALGYRDIHLFGFDGCIKDSHHAYKQKENDGETVRQVFLHDKEYKMTDWMIAQAQNFDEFVRRYDDFKLTVHSDGIIKHIRENYAS